MSPSCLAVNPNVAWTWIGSRTPSTNSLIAGWNRYMNASIRCLPARSAAAAISSASAALSPIGFSHRTCFPASSARTVHSLCRLFGSGL